MLDKFDINGVPSLLAIIFVLLLVCNGRDDMVELLVVIWYAFIVL